MSTGKQFACLTRSKTLESDDKPCPLFMSDGCVSAVRVPGHRYAPSKLWKASLGPDELRKELVCGEADVYLPVEYSAEVATALAQTAPIPSNYFAFEVLWGVESGRLLTNICDEMRARNLRLANVRETMLFALSDDRYSRDMACFGGLDNGRLLAIWQNKDEMWLEPTTIGPEAKLFEAGGLIAVLVS